MKKIHMLIAVLLVAATTLCGAQTNVQGRPHQRKAAQQINRAALTALQNDLQSAIGAMTSALPIYDGNRVRSIHAAHNALLIVDRALVGRNAKVRTKPTVRDNVRSSHAHSKYSAQQIAASQASMNQGLGFLQAATRDLQSATGGKPGKRGARVGALLQKAIQEATTAINLHAGR